MMNLLHIDFTTMGPGKDGKDCNLVMMDMFSNFGVAVVTPKHQVKIVANALADRWFYTYGIPSWIHIDRGKSCDNSIIHTFCKLSRIKWSTNTLYNPPGNSKYQKFNKPLHGLLKTLPKYQEPNWHVHLSLWCFHIMLHLTLSWNSSCTSFCLGSR